MKIYFNGMKCISNYVNHLFTLYKYSLKNCTYFCNTRSASKCHEHVYECYGHFSNCVNTLFTLHECFLNVRLTFSLNISKLFSKNICILNIFKYEKKE